MNFGYNNQSISLLIVEKGVRQRVTKAKRPRQTLMLRWKICEREVSAHEYYVGVVKDKWTGKNGLEFRIGWRYDRRDSKYDTWEPITNLPGSENMIAEFNNKSKEDNKIKTAAAL
jgi:hypothetical protein